jgi:hypothetical protein
MLSTNTTSNLQTTSSATAKPACLGNTAKYVGDSAQVESRNTRFKHQRSAALLLEKGSRTGLCMWCVASLQYGVDVIHNPTEQKSRYNGLQTCGSVWSCPCCAARISEQRRNELNQLLAWSRKKDYAIFMLTLTTRHNKKQSLKEVLDKLKDAKKRLAQHSAFKRIKPKLIGYVTATEVNGGGPNGWHPHFHIIFIIDDFEPEACSLLESLRSAWLKCLTTAGLSGNDAAFQVQAADHAHRYVGKWGAGEELALGHKKSSREGRSPFQLLADFSDNADHRAGELFKEYAKVFKGRRQLIWSDGLKDLANIELMTDEKASELEELTQADKLIYHFGSKSWARVREHRSTILKFSELAGTPGVDACVAAIRNKLRKPKPVSKPK